MGLPRRWRKRATTSFCTAALRCLSLIHIYAAIESAVALVRTDMLTDTSITYESAMEQIKNDLEMTIPGLSE